MTVSCGFHKEMRQINEDKTPATCIHYQATAFEQAKSINPISILRKLKHWKVKEVTIKSTANIPLVTLTFPRTEGMNSQQWHFW